MTRSINIWNNLSIEMKNISKTYALCSLAHIIKIFLPFHAHTPFSLKLHVDLLCSYLGEGVSLLV